MDNIYRVVTVDRS